SAFRGLAGPAEAGPYTVLLRVGLLSLCVAVLAVGTDGAPVRCCVAAVVTTETAIGRNVSDVVWVHPERHLHGREHVAAVDVLQSGNRTSELMFVECAAAGVEGAKSLRDFLQSLLLGRILRLHEPDAFATHIR